MPSITMFFFYFSEKVFNFSKRTCTISSRLIHSTILTLKEYRGLIKVNYTVIRFCQFWYLIINFEYPHHLVILVCVQQEEICVVWSGLPHWSSWRGKYLTPCTYGIQKLNYFTTLQMVLHIQKIFLNLN